MTPPRNTVHATCLSLGGRGVLLRGAAGAGKSDLAFRLIGSPPPAFLPGVEAAVLVSDDRVVIEAEDGGLFASPPASIAGKLEVRGVGIVAVPYVARAKIALVADLTARGEVPRLPEDPLPSRELHGVFVPHLVIDPLEASAPLKLWAAVRFMC